MATMRNQSLVWLEIFFVIGAFQLLLGRDLLFALAGSPLEGDALVLDDSGSSRGQSNLLNLVPLLIVYSGTFFFFTMRKKYAALFDRRHIPLYIFLVIVVASAAWSDSSSVTLRRAVGLMGTVAFGAYVALAFKPATGLRLIVVALAIFCVVSFVLAVGVPSLGRHTSAPHTGLWNGMHGHKNTLGRDVVLSALIFLAYFLSQRAGVFNRLLLAGLLAVCGVLLVGSWSGTALLGAGLLLLVFVSLRLMAGTGRVNVTVLLIGALSVTALAGFLYVFFEDILRLLGKDPTLTGRTSIWEAVIAAGMDQPWLGAGYRTFWVGASYERFESYLDYGLRHAGHAHNSFLDLWLEVGFVGAAAMAVVLVVLLWRGLQINAAAKLPINMLPVLLVASLVYFAMSARVLAEQAELAWLLFIIGWFWAANRQLPVLPARPAAAAPAARMSLAARAAAARRRAAPANGLALQRRWANH